MKASVWTLLVCFLGAYTVACLIHFLAFLAVWWRKKTSPTSIVREVSTCEIESRCLSGFYRISHFAGRVSDTDGAINGSSSRGSSRCCAYTAGVCEDVKRGFRHLGNIKGVSVGLNS